jgi:predicted nucleic acid-binding protein
LAGVIVADASWVIALMDPEDEHHAAAVSLVDSIEGRRLMHAVTLSECLVAPASAGRSEEVVAELRSAFEIVHTDDQSALRWAQLRASERLRLPDAIALDTALVVRSPTIVSFDGALIAAARRVGLNVLP